MLVQHLTYECSRHDAPTPRKDRLYTEEVWSAWSALEPLEKFLALAPLSSFRPRRMPRASQLITLLSLKLLYSGVWSVLEPFYGLSGFGSTHLGTRPAYNVCLALLNL